MTEVPRGRQGHWPASSTHASISCRDCRKRKIKCDRSLPTCFVCLKNGQECSYPVGPLKPGPKIGSSRRRMARRKVDTSCHCKQGVCGSLDAQSQPDLCHQSSQSSEPQQGFDYIGLPSPGSEDPPPTGLDSDERTSVPSTTTNGSSVRVSSLFWILHPSHDVKLDPNSSTRPPMTSGRMSDEELSSVQDDVCQALGTTLEDIRSLIDLYFSNMTAFSLFHQPTFTEKLLQIDSKHDLYALLAAMFSFSSRYRSQPVQATESRQVDKDKNLPTSEEFLNLAYEYTSTAFNAYADEPPSMSLLQAVVLTTFAELIKGVRARAWRSVGTCVRVAYERQLHLIDADSEPGTIQAETWVVEEQRRTWWAIWELDVFASTVRRSPTAIDWDTNETFLPVDDEFWFACTPQPSCFLERDPEMRWKSLQASKNLSPKAWFIAINSIMRNAQVLSNPRGGARSVAVRRDPSAPSRHPPKALKQARRSVTESTDDLSILNNSLYCFLMALPDHLRHRGGFLAFCDDPTRGRSRQLDSDIYSIHIMTQLARFMISRENLYWEVEKESPSPHQEDPQLDHLPDTTEGERRWKCYLDTADGIMDIVSSSSPDHFQHINPFLGSTIWLGAAILLVHFRLAPSKPLVNRRLIESKFDLLQAVLVKLSSWWGMSTILTDRLSLLQSGLQYPGEGNRSANTAHPHRPPQSQLQHRASFDWSITQDQSDPPLVTSEEGGTVEPSHDEPANPLDQHRILGPGDSPCTMDSSTHQKQDRNPILDQDTPSLLFEPHSRVGYDSLGMPDTIGELFSENPATSDLFKNFNMRHQMEFPDFLNDIFPTNARI